MKFGTTGAIAILIAAAGMGAARATPVNLVSNASWETGDFTGWAQFGDLSWTSVNYGQSDANGVPLNAFATDGTYYGEFGPTGVGGVSQTVGVAGLTYTIAFDLASLPCWGENCDGGDQISAVLGFGGLSVTLDAPMSMLSDPPYIQPGELQNSWKHYSFTMTALDDSGLSFAFHNPLSYFLLDNVSVTAADAPAESVPEPAVWPLMLAGVMALGYAPRRGRQGAGLRVPSPAGAAR